MNKQTIKTIKTIKKNNRKHEKQTKNNNTQATSWRSNDNSRISYDKIQYKIKFDDIQPSGDSQILRLKPISFNI